MMQRLPSIVEWFCVETAVVVGREMVLVLLQVTAALHNSETVHIYLRLKSNMWTYGVEMHDIMPIRTLKAHVSVMKCHSKNTAD